MSWKELGNQALHVLMAVAILIWIVLEPDAPDAYALAGFLVGLFREDAQHRSKEGWWWWWPIEYIGEHKGKVVGIGGWGRWWDIGAFTLGGAGMGVLAMLT